MASMSPPMPALCGSTTPSIAAAATAASAALPPSRRTWSPACAASGWLVATTPWRARTSDRVCSVQFHSRSPRTAVMLADGFGPAFVGTPNGFGEMSPEPASAPEATTTASATIPMAATPSRRVIPLRTPTDAPPSLVCARIAVRTTVHYRSSKHVEHLPRGALSALDTSVEIALAVRRGVLAGEHCIPLAQLQIPPEVRVLAGREPGIRTVDPRVVDPG